MTSGPSRDALSRALDVLERFLDRDLRSIDRTLALNDDTVPDETVLGFLRVLDPSDRLLALACCWRSGVLAEWAGIAERPELAVIAHNCRTPLSTFQLLLADADEDLRVHVTHGCVEHPEIVAWLLADPSPRVRMVMREALEEYRLLHEQMREQFRADAPVDWLHEAVPAAENEDLLEAYAAEKLWRKYGPPSDEPCESFDADQELVAENPDPELEAAVAVLKGVFGADRVLGDAPVRPGAADPG